MREVFFHVGLGKTGSTWLQKVLFPHLKGIHYIPTRRYQDSANIIRSTHHEKYLVSREFDRQFESETRKFSKEFPHAKIIIFLRRHDSWIASQYRRFVKNGFAGNFTDFINIEDDNGYWKKKDLFFYPFLKFIEEFFQSRPLIIFYDEFKNNPEQAITSICNFMNATIDLEKINLNPKHVSYSDKQLKVVRRVGKYFFRPDKTPIKIKPLRFMRRVSHISTRTVILSLASLVPDSWMKKEDLIPSIHLEKIRNEFQKDWDQCIEYSRMNIPGSRI